MLNQQQYMQAAATRRYKRWATESMSTTTDRRKAQDMLFAPSCRHAACISILDTKRIAQRTRRGGVIAVPLVELASGEPHVLLGKNCTSKATRVGDTGMYSVCSGGAEPEDGNCFYRTVRREMNEEFKLLVGDDDIIDWFMHLGSPVFVIRLQGGSLGPPQATQILAAINDARDRVLADRADESLPDTMREMCDLALVPLSQFPASLIVEASSVLPPAESSDVAMVWPEIQLVPLTRDVMTRLVYHSDR